MVYRFKYLFLVNQRDNSWESWEWRQVTSNSCRICFSDSFLQAEASQTPRDMSPQEPPIDSDLSMQDRLSLHCRICRWKVFAEMWCIMVCVGGLLLIVPDCYRPTKQLVLPPDFPISNFILPLKSCSGMIRWVRRCVLPEATLCSVLPASGLQGPRPGLHEDVALDEGSAHFRLGWSWLGFWWERSPAALILRRQPCHARRGSLRICRSCIGGGETFRRKDHRRSPNRSGRCRESTTNLWGAETK